MGCAFFLLPQVNNPPDLSHQTSAEKNTKFSVAMIKFLKLAPPVFAGYFLMMLGFSSIKLLALERFNLFGVALIGPCVRWAAAVGAITAGHFTKPSNQDRLLVFALSLGLAGSLIIIFSSELYLMGIGSVCVGLSFSSIYPIVSCLIKSENEKDFNQANGAFHIFNTAGMLSGLLAARFVEPVTAIGLATCLLIASILSFLSVKSNLWKF